MIKRIHKILFIIFLMALSYAAGYWTADSESWGDIKEKLTDISESIGSKGGVDPEDLDGLDRVLVIDVIDGDTIDIRYFDGSEERVRMLGIDTPESYGENDPSKWNCDIQPIVLDMWGHNAKQTTTDALLNTYVYLEYDEVAGERGYYGRLLAYIILQDGTNYNAYLVREGYARVYTSADFTYMDQFLEYESDSRLSGKGVWVECEQSNKTGMRIDMLNPYDEYVMIANYTDAPVSLGGWTLKDAAGATYEFPEGFVLGMSSSVKVYSGTGVDTNSELYWNHIGNIWNNSSDTAMLTDAGGHLVYTFTY